MNVNQKIYRFILVLACVFTIAMPQSGFSSGNYNSEEVVIKFFEYNSHLFGEKAMYGAFSKSELEQSCKSNKSCIKNAMENVSDEFLIFNEPGTQKITIENYLTKDVDIGHMIFIGDEFTAPLIAHSVSIQGSSGCSTIKAGTNCTFLINAKENASATLNPEGEQLLLQYRVAGDKEDKFFKLKLKINYNDDIFFGVRNLNLKLNYKDGIFPDYTEYDCIGKPHTINDFIRSGKLTLINNNPKDSVHIKSVRFGRKGVVGKIDYLACSTLKSNESCTANISINYEPKNDVLPILVTYDIDGKEDKKDLTAIAAAIVNDALEKHTAETGQPGQASFSGGAAGSFGVMAYELASKKVLIVIIANSKAADIGANIIAGPLAGAAFWQADKVVDNAFDKKYDIDYGYNRVIDALAMHLAFAAIPCVSLGIKAATAATPLGGVATGGICLVASVGCGLAGTFGGKYLTEALYSNIVNRLPEQLWRPWFWNKSKSAFNFGASAVIRMSCKIWLSSTGIIDIPYIVDGQSKGNYAILHGIDLNDNAKDIQHTYFYDGGLTGGVIEVGQDILSGATMTVLDGMFPSAKNTSAEEKISFTDNSCYKKECICRYNK